MADEIPADVREYLLAGDGLGKVVAIEKHPGVEARLKTPEVQATLYHYLESEEPWHEQIPVLTMAALDELLANPTPEGAKSVRKVAAHPNPLVRIRAYRYLFAVVYPDDRAGMYGVLEDMLTDDDETVRREAARQIRNLKLAASMHSVLQNWLRVAPDRKWDRGESYAIIQELAK